MRTLALIIGIHLSNSVAHSQDAMVAARPTELEDPLVMQGLRGTGMGGTLVLVNAGDGMEQRFQISTTTGESAASVIARLGTLVASSRPDVPGLTDPVRDLNDEIAFRFPEALGGTEVGFGFTPCPIGLTGFVDWPTHELAFRWENRCNENYDVLRSGGMSGGAATHARQLESLSIRMQMYASVKLLTGWTPGQRRLNLWGIKDGIPSAPASIWVDNCLFREATDPPPSAGLHPNWGRFEIPGQSAPTLDRGEDPPYVRPTGTIMVDGEPRDAREVFPFKPWHESPEKKQGYQKVLMPSGATALYRPVVGQTAGDRFEASLLLRVKERSSLGENWFVDVLAWNGAPEALETEIARHARERLEGIRPDITGRGFIPVYTSASTPPETEDWFEVSSAAATGPEGIVISPGGTKWTLVVVAGNLGGAELGTDWLTVKKLNCSDLIPEGYDPW